MAIAPTARDYIARRGGDLYIWVDAGGLVRQAFTPPESSGQWLAYDDGTARVHVAPSAGVATEWSISLRRFPRRRLEIATELTPGHSPSEAGFWWG
jgi:hypothetical protein